MLPVMKRIPCIAITACVCLLVCGCSNTITYDNLDQVEPWSRSGEAGVSVSRVEATRSDKSIQVVRVSLPSHQDRRYYGLKWPLGSVRWERYTGIRFSVRCLHAPAVLRFKLVIWSEYRFQDDVVVPDGNIIIDDTQWHDYKYPFSVFKSWYTGLDDPAHGIRLTDVEEVDIILERMGSNQPESALEFGPVIVYRTSPRYQFW
jgi:hypothetical protein